VCVLASRLSSCQSPAIRRIMWHASFTKERCVCVFSSLVAHLKRTHTHTHLASVCQHARTSILFHFNSSVCVWNLIRLMVKPRWPMHSILIINYSLKWSVLLVSGCVVRFKLCFLLLYPLHVPLLWMIHFYVCLCISLQHMNNVFSFHFCSFLIIVTCVYVVLRILFTILVQLLKMSKLASEAATTSTEKTLSNRELIPVSLLLSFFQ
jgi:hypothetical protein